LTPEEQRIEDELEQLANMAGAMINTQKINYKLRAEALEFESYRRQLNQ
jgi:hypothetical protein